MNLCIKAHLTRTHTYIQVKVRHAKLYRHACQQLSAGTPSRPGLVRKWYQAGKSDGTKQARSTSTKQVGQLVPSRLDLLEPSRPGLRVPSRPDLLVPSRQVNWYQAGRSIGTKQARPTGNKQARVPRVPSRRCLSTGTKQAVQVEPHHLPI